MGDATPSPGYGGSAVELVISTLYGLTIPIAFSSRKPPRGFFIWLSLKGDVEVYRALIPFEGGFISWLPCIFVSSTRTLSDFIPGLGRPAFFVSEAPKAITLSEVFRFGRE